MRRPRLSNTILLAAAFALAPFVANQARAQSDQQTLVDRATLTVQETVEQARPDSDLRKLMRKARGVLVCPRVFRAGFIIGGSGGGCALVARDPHGVWSYPAFYGMGSGSVGFQIGIQDSAIVMMILTEKALAAVMDSQFKFGGDANLAVATIGAGVEGATTADLGADIVAFSQSRGLFAGVSLQGSVLGSRVEWNRAYYGRDLGSRQIIADTSIRNQGAEPLREVLARASDSQAVAAAPPPAEPTGPAPSRGVQRQNLAPPRR